MGEKEMSFEQARENFVKSLDGSLSEPPDYNPIFPSEEALNRLATVTEPMDKEALEVLREEIVDEWFTNDDPSMIFAHPTWAQAVLLVREYRRQSENYGEWRCSVCGRESYDTAEGVLLCECGAEMKRVPDDQEQE